MEIKKNIPNNTITRKLVDLDHETGNIYETINILARRANQISTELKTELNRKLADFSSPTDTSMEETFENREQIEISRYYERLPKPTIIARRSSSTMNSNIGWPNPQRKRSKSINRARWDRTIGPSICRGAGFCWASPEASPHTRPHTCVGRW